MGKYLNHITLSTGHNRKSPLSEVSLETRQLLKLWIKKCIKNGGANSLPIHDFSDFSAEVFDENGTLILSVFKNKGSDLALLITMIVENRADHAKTSWEKLINISGQGESLSMPEVPFCAVAINIDGILKVPESTVWLGDFERCVAWTWMVD